MDAMDKPKNGTEQPAGLAAETVCCGGAEHTEHSPATCPCLCHRAAPERPDEHLVTIDLRRGALIVEFTDDGVPLPTFAVGTLSANRLLSAGTFLTHREIGRAHV